MEREITIGLEEYKALLEEHVLMQNAERKLQRKRKERNTMLYLYEVADLLGVEWEDEEHETV